MFKATLRPFIGPQDVLQLEKPNAGTVNLEP